MAFEGIVLPHQGGKRRNAGAIQSAAVAIPEVPVEMPPGYGNAEAVERLPEGRGATLPAENQIEAVSTIEKYCDPGAEDFTNLGELLVYLRLTYFDRISGGDPDRPRSELKAAAVVEYLRTNGYSMTSGSYSMLEKGKTLPRNPEHFLKVISKCFKVDQSSKYWLLLRRQYVYDHTVRFVGKEFADQTVVHGSALLKAMREGRAQ